MKTITWFQLQTLCVLFSAAVLIPAFSAFAEEVNMSPEAQAVDSSCSQEAVAANCGDKKIGTGLHNCIRAYQGANPSFHISPGCKAAMKQMRADRYPRPAPVRSHTPLGNNSN
jgi:hypothetical protein